MSAELHAQTFVKDITGQGETKLSMNHMFNS